MKLIDFQLLITHVIGFLIVLWLLRKYAWGRVLGFLEQRRVKIQGEFDEIETQRTHVDVLRREYEDHLRNIEAEARQKIQEAVAEGNAAAAKIKDRAQEERRQRLERAEEEVRLLEESAKETLRKRTVDLALKAAEKAVQERLDEPKHEEMMKRFVDELDAVSE
ncbi:MAG: F0F1 ATP synthase subunit B [Candidatus Eisenbacteria sp.]|nr:F0F1 ATP synthase subunit B [Candidatus Eisenbacteria bacterium]